MAPSHYLNQWCMWLIWSLSTVVNWNLLWIGFFNSWKCSSICYQWCSRHFYPREIWVNLCYQITKTSWYPCDRGLTQVNDWTFILHWNLEIWDAVQLVRFALLSFDIHVLYRDDFMTRECNPHHRPFVRGIQWWPEVAHLKKLPTNTPCDHDIIYQGNLPCLPLSCEIYCMKSDV